MAEALDVILRLFQGEIVTEKTDWYELVERVAAPAALLRSRIPRSCVVSAVTPSGGRLAGKYDLGMICVAADQPVGFDALDVNWQTRERGRGRARPEDGPGAAAAGRPCTSPRPAKRPGNKCASGSRTTSTTSTTTCRASSYPTARTRSTGSSRQGTAVIGTPDDAIALIERLYEKTGEFGALLLGAHDWARWEAPSARTSCTRAT